MDPRSKADPAATVVGTENGCHILAPVEFGSPFKLDSDALVERYDTTGHKVSIEPFDEAREYMKFSTEKFDRGNKLADRRQKAQEAESTPEDQFRAAAEAAADAQ